MLFRAIAIIVGLLVAGLIWYGLIVRNPDRAATVAGANFYAARSAYQAAHPAETPGNPFANLTGFHSR